MRLLALGELCRLVHSRSHSLTTKTDGGGIRGLSELLMIKGIMHRLMVEENERKKDGQAPLSVLPKPCDYFDLIGGTGTGGCAAFVPAHICSIY